MSLRHLRNLRIAISCQRPGWPNGPEDPGEEEDDGEVRPVG